MPNPIMNALLRLQPTARRVEDETGLGFDDDAAVQGMHQAAAPVDPLGTLRGERKNELTERIFNERRAPSGNLDALNFLMGDIEQDEAQDPFQQQIRADRSASLAGFPSSEAAGEYGRGMEEMKLQMPLDVARTTAQGRVQEAGIRGRTAVDQARAQGQSALDKQKLIESTKTQGFDALGKMLGAQGAGADGRSRSMSVPGVGAMSVGAERPDAQLPAAHATNLMNARRQFARTKSPQDKIAVDQAVANLVNASPASDTSKQWAHAIAANPRLSAMPLEDIIKIHQDKTGDQLDPDEITELRNLMSQVLAGMNDPQQ